jgi:hypothetical protein
MMNTAIKCCVMKEAGEAQVGSSKISVKMIENRPRRRERRVSAHLGGADVKGVGGCWEVARQVGEDGSCVGDGREEARMREGGKGRRE